MQREHVDVINALHPAAGDHGNVYAPRQINGRVDIASGQHPVAADIGEQDGRHACIFEPARQIIGAAELTAATGTYLPVSCAAEDARPYQGTAYLTFDLPTITETPAYFREMTRALTARGWTVGLPPSHHPGGRTLSKDGVTAIFYRHPDIPRRGVLRLWGQCRNMTDHRLEPGGVVDISESLYG